MASVDAAALSDLGVVVEVQTAMSPLDPDSTGYAVNVNGEALELYDFDPDEPGGNDGCAVMGRQSAHQP